MRDIRSDLEERAKLIEAEANRVVTRFEKQIEPLRREYDARVADLKSRTGRTERAHGVRAAA